MDLFLPIHDHVRVTVQGHPPFDSIVAHKSLFHPQRGHGGLQLGESPQMPVEHSGKVPFNSSRFFPTGITACWRNCSFMPSPSIKVAICTRKSPLLMSKSKSGKSITCSFSWYWGVPNR